MPRVFASIALAFLAIACNSSSGTATDAGTDLGGDVGDPYVYHQPPVPDGAILLETDPFTIPAGSETTTCSYTAVMPSADVTTRELHSYQMRGGHHAVVFYTTEIQPVGSHPCSATEMESWRFLGGGQESQESALQLPPGVGLQIPAHAQLVIQSHYINLDPVAHTVRDAMVIQPAAPGALQYIADSYNIYDDSLSIPPHATYGRTLECTLDADADFVTALGHTHEFGTRARIETVLADGTVHEIYNEMGGTRLEFSPPIYQFTGANALHLHAGDKLRLYCDWQNTTSDTLQPPREMCAALLYYYPGRGAIVCGNVIATRGAGDAGTVMSTNGNAGCSTPPGPTDPCVRTCNTGNELGVGKYCSHGGHQCQNNGAAFLCTADVDTSSPDGFCTKPCQTSATCGSGAVCTGDSRGMGCVPVECAGDSDAGAATDAAVTDAAVTDP